MVASKIEQFVNVPTSALLSSHHNIIISQFQFNLNENENEKKYTNFIYSEISSHFAWNFIFHFLHFAYFFQQFIISNLKLNEFFHNTSIEPSLHSFSFHMEISSISDIIEFFLSFFLRIEIFKWYVVSIFPFDECRAKAIWYKSL